MKPWNKSKSIALLCILILILSMITIGFAEDEEVIQSEGEVLENQEPVINDEQAENEVPEETISIEGLENEETINNTEEENENSEVQAVDAQEPLINEEAESSTLEIQETITDEKIETEKLENELLKNVDLVEENFNLLSNEELDRYLESLSSKDLSKVLKKIDKSKAKVFFEESLKILRSSNRW